MIISIRMSVVEIQYNDACVLIDAIKIISLRITKKHWNEYDEFVISIIVTFSVIMRLSCEWPVVSRGGNRSAWRKPPPNHKSLATLSHACTGFESSQWQCLRPLSHQGRSHDNGVEDN